MTGKEFFQRVQTAKRAIRALESQIESIEDVALRSPRLSASGVRSRSGEHSALERAVVGLIDKEQQLAEQIQDYRRTMDEAERVINMIGDEHLRNVLRYRYLVGLRWDDVAKSVGYDLRYTFKLHGRALRAAERIIGIR